MVGHDPSWVDLIHLSSLSVLFGCGVASHFCDGLTVAAWIQGCSSSLVVVCVRSLSLQLSTLVPSLVSLRGGESPATASADIRHVRGSFDSTNSSGLECS
mmetsp:Transcript_4548/g.15299  ORF Transcript_4548/g.15299 Transcript_4548/m.15299 type:complete len:100 (+) Transcript_4548:134-433(+)